MPRWSKILLLVLLIILTLGIVIGIVGLKNISTTMMASFSGQPQAPTVVTSDVVTSPAESQLWTPKLSAVGTLKSVHGIGVTSETAGLITEILFESNQPVEKGDALIKLDSAVQTANIQTIRSQLELANSELQRQRELRRRGVNTQAALEQATTQVSQLNAQLAAQQAIADQKTIRAPFAGRMGIRHVSLGQYLTPGTPIASLGTVDPIYVDFSLPEKHIPDLTVGLPVIATVDAFPDAPINGSITSTELLADVRTHSIGIRATLPNKQRTLRPGMFAQVQVLLPQEQRVLVIPQTAVTFNPYGKSIWVITGETEDEYPVAGSTPGDPTAKMAKAWHVEQRFITTGATRGDYIAVTKGLQEGDRVVTTGQFKLRPGSVVSFNNAAAPNAEMQPPE